VCSFLSLNSFFFVPDLVWFLVGGPFDVGLGPLQYCFQVGNFPCFCVSGKPFVLYVFCPCSQLRRIVLRAAFLKVPPPPFFCFFPPFSPNSMFHLVVMPNLLPVFLVFPPFSKMFISLPSFKTKVGCFRAQPAGPGNFFFRS